MAELLKNGAVFIHVPKCGGTWVRQVLRSLNLLRDRVGYKHSIPAHVNDIMKYRPGQFIRHWPLHPLVTPRKLRESFKFCFVRNPLTWYESWWKFMAGGWHPWEADRWHPQRPIDNCGDDDFNAFLTKVLDQRPGYVSEMYGLYADESVAFVGKCENTAEDLVEVLGRMGVKFDENSVRNHPRENVSKSRMGNPDWDPLVLRRVIDSESAGIERFGYWPNVEAFCKSRGVALGV